MMPTLSRRQFAVALGALLQPPSRPQTAPSVEQRRREATMAMQAGALRAELAKSGAGSWDRWMQHLEPVRAEWRRVAKRPSPRARNGYVFNKNALPYLVDTDLEAGPESTRPLDVIVAFDRKMKRRGIDLLYVPIPAIEEVYPENFLDSVPDDLTVQPAMRRFLLSLLEQDVEVMDLLRPFQAARAGYRLGLKVDDHWNDVQIELAASLVADRLRRYGFVRAAAADAKRYTIRPVAIRGERGITSMRQVITPSGALYDDVEQSPVLVVGDSNLQVYQYLNENLRNTGEHAGFSAHLARYLGLPVSLEAVGGFRPGALNRDPVLFQRRRVVVFVGAAWLISTVGWEAVDD